jgi:hypothetical protein
MWAVEYAGDFANRRLSPPVPPLRENRLQVAFKQGAGVLEVLFGVGFRGGDAVEGFVEDGDDAMLFKERGDAHEFIVNKVPVERWNADTAGESLKVEVLQQVKNKPRIVPVEILYVQNRVERPEIVFDEKDIADASTAASCNTWPANRDFVMRISNSA